jgi:hypothetical protein
VACQVPARRRTRHHRPQAGIEDHPQARLLVGRGVEGAEGVAEPLGVHAGGGRGRLVDQGPALEQFAAEVGLAARQAPLGLAHPGAEAVGPRLQRERVAGVLLQDQLGRPAVAVAPEEGGDPPAGFSPGPVTHDGPEHVVALLEDVGRDDERLPDDALDRVATIVHHRGHPLDHDRLPRLGHCHRSTKYAFSSSNPRASRSPTPATAVADLPRVSSTREAVRPR